MENKLLKIDCIMYKVSDLKKAEAFYTNVLGLKKAWEDEETGMVGLMFEKSNSEIVIHTNPGIPPFDYIYSVENVDSFCAEVKKQGYGVVVEPLEVRTGKYAVVADLDGNRIPIIDLTKFGGIPRYD